jgi:SAM-dependent methyltransferase
MAGLLRQTYWEIRKEPDKWLAIIGQHVSPSLRARLKYESELDYWRGELENLRKWFIRRETDWWGVEPPPEEIRLPEDGSRLWQTVAIERLHARYPYCAEELGVALDDFAGKRILEIGCGPLLPILQFERCERHGLDPLMAAFADAGWPIYDLDARMLQGYGERMPYPDGYFDGVICRNALDHVDDVAAVGREIARVLKPGGRFLGAVEYHPPTREEPHQLDDEAMVSLFAGLDMRKVSDRGKRAFHEDLARRHALDLAALNRRSSPDSPNRHTAWHGTKRV